MGVRIGADIGGTFTDAVLEDGPRRHRVKLLTTHEAPDRALLEAVDRLLDEAGQRIDDVEVFVHGTTLATNALLERRGARTGLLTTDGFRDVLELGDESRFDQYDLSIVKPVPLVPRALRLGVRERIAATGAVLEPLRRDDVAACARVFRQAGVTSIAVCFLHSYRNDAHERQAAEWLAHEMADVPISLSSEVSPELREYPRFSTTVANAYVQPVVGAYLGRLATELARRGARAPLLLMLSSGGVTTVETARRFPIRLVESGPAGGAAFAAHVALERGLDRVIAFDMGGTTAKLCLIDNGEPHMSESFEVGRVHRFRKGSGLPLRIPVVEMVEIGAGGGSIATRDAAGRLLVGPESASSEPGPACYGRGGRRPTVTDADLLLGRLDADAFAGGHLPLRTGAATDAMATLGGGGGPMMLALGVSEMVDEAMAGAARVHATERGESTEGRTLVVSGGAAPLHALRVAEKLGIDRVIVPPDAGVGSAVGFLRAPISFEVQRSLPQHLDAIDRDAVNALLGDMADTAHAVVAGAVGDQPRTERREVYARYVGQGHEIAVKLPDRPVGPSDIAQLAADFEARYCALYGSAIPSLPVELLTWRVRVSAPAVRTPPATPSASPAASDGDAIWRDTTERRDVVDPATGHIRSVAVFHRERLSAGERFRGPAIVLERDTATNVPDTFDGCIDGGGAIVLTRRAPGREIAR